jgi:hypothetical protein
VIPGDGVAGWISARHPRDSARKSAKARDALCIEQAERIQRAHRGWVVMWSAWRRTFTAFGCFSQARLVVDEPTADGLVDQMRRIELRHSAIRAGVTRQIPGAGPPTRPVFPLR